MNKHAPRHYHGMLLVKVTDAWGGLARWETVDGRYHLRPIATNRGKATYYGTDAEGTWLANPDADKGNLIDIGFRDAVRMFSRYVERQNQER